MKAIKFFQSKTLRAFALAALALFPLCAFANTTHIEPGHSALWIDPARNGEGWIVEILQDDTAVLFYYGSDEEGDPRWFVSHAPIVRGEEGDKIIFDELVSGYGGRFGPDYTADDVSLVTVGSAEFSFSDCESGNVSFTAHGISRSYSLVRLSRTMGAGCAPLHGTPGLPIQPYAGTSSTWFDPAKDGQAFTLHWQDDGLAMMFWYSYDTQGNQLWMSGVGNYEDGHIVFEDVVSVRGGRFDEDYPPEQPVLVPWGRLEMELDCERGTATYESTVAGFGSGSFSVSRLTDLAKPACPWVKPKLTDLYDIALIPIPDEPAGPVLPYAYASDNIIFHDTVSDTGAVAGRRRLFLNAGASVKFQMAQWKPGLASWETPVNTYIWYRSFVSSDGDRVLIGAENGYHPNFIKIKPTFFQDGVLEPLAGTADFTSHIMGASRNLAQVTGTIARLITLPSGYTGWHHAPWVWSATFGQVELPLTDDVPDAEMVAVSNDGRTAIGDRRTFIENPWNPEAVVTGGGDAVRWLDRQLPHRLIGRNGAYLGYTSACSANCEIVFGNNSWARIDDSLGFGVLRDASFEAWYWRANGESGSLGAPNNNTEPTGGNPKGWSFHLASASADGTLLVGSYLSKEMQSVIPNWGDGLIWSQDTGYVTVSGLLDELGHDLDWYSTRAADISSNGRYILLTTDEVHTPGPDRTSSSHAALLKLTPKPR